MGHRTLAFHSGYRSGATTWVLRKGNRGKTWRGQKEDCGDMVRFSEGPPESVRGKFDWK